MHRKIDKEERFGAMESGFPAVKRTKRLLYSLSMTFPMGRLIGRAVREEKEAVK